VSGLGAGDQPRGVAPPDRESSRLEPATERLPKLDRMVAATLSLLVPGLGHLLVGAYRRAAVLLALTLVVVLAAGAAVLAHPALGLRLLVVLLLLDLALFGLRAFAVVDAGRSAAPAFVTVLLVVAVAPHVAAGYVAVRGYAVADRVFAHAQPRDVLPSRGVFVIDEPAAKASPPLPRGRPLVASEQVLETAEPAERPWTTILLLGTDEGPGNWGARTDSIILVAFEHGTRRAVAFGIPRNLTNVRVGGTLPVFREPINGLYSYARAHPEILPPERDAGASALKLAVSQLLGVRVDYYALANLRGFAGLVDALGGVTIHVKERLHDSVTRAAWGEPKPRIDVYPGRTYHFDGHEALAYVRSRKDSNDYTRMARQRCFLSALADQVDPLDALRHFGSIARTVEHNVRTDIPLDRLPRLIRLATHVDPQTTLTITFGPEYIRTRRKSDNFPIPSVPRIRAAAREALLAPRASEDAGTASVAHTTC
jgi:polyisoprenyl-teichoic acid--peptidoglycan teichoic acid transferase